MAPPSDTQRQLEELKHSKEELFKRTDKDMVDIAKLRGDVELQKLALIAAKDAALAAVNGCRDDIDDLKDNKKTSAATILTWVGLIVGPIIAVVVTQLFAVHPTGGQ